VRIVKKYLTEYLIERCDQPIAVVTRLDPDLRAMTADASEHDTIEVGLKRLNRRAITDTSFQLLKLVLVAAVFSPESNGRIVSTMAKLGPNVAKQIQKCIEDVVDASELPTTHVQALESASLASSPQTSSQDTEALIQSRLAEANARYQAMIVQNSKLITDLDASRSQIASLQEELSAPKAMTSQPNHRTSIERLREEHADVVSALEEELFNYKSEVSTQAKQIASLNSAISHRLKIEKERDQLRREVDDYERESNASENLKKKVKSLQDAQRATDALRTDYDIAIQELNELRPLREQFPTVQRRLEALTQHIADMEDETVEERLARRRAETELSFLNQSLQDSRAQNQRDQEALGEYQGRLRELETNQGDLSFASLDHELSFSSPLQSPPVSMRDPATPGTGDYMSRSSTSEVLSPSLPSPQFLALLARPRRSVPIIPPTLPASTYASSLHRTRRVEPKRMTSYTITLRATISTSPMLLPSARVRAQRPPLIRSTASTTTPTRSI
jgi:hypothetical protein